MHLSHPVCWTPLGTRDCKVCEPRAQGLEDVSRPCAKLCPVFGGISLYVPCWKSAAIKSLCPLGTAPSKALGSLWNSPILYNVAPSQETDKNCVKTGNSTVSLRKVLGTLGAQVLGACVAKTRQPFHGSGGNRGYRKRRSGPVQGAPWQAALAFTLSCLWGFRSGRLRRNTKSASSPAAATRLELQTFCSAAVRHLALKLDPLK